MTTCFLRVFGITPNHSNVTSIYFRDGESGLPRGSPSKEAHPLGSASPSVAATSARNRSPSASPSPRPSDVVPNPRDVVRTIGGRHEPSPAGFRHQDVRLPSLESRYVSEYFS